MNDIIEYAKIFTTEQQENINNNIMKLLDENDKNIQSTYEEIIQTINNNNTKLEIVEFDNKLDSTKYNYFMSTLEKKIKKQYEEIYLIRDLLNKHDEYMKRNLEDINSKINILKTEMWQLRAMTIENNNAIEISINPINYSLVEYESSEFTKEELEFIYSDPRTGKIIENKIDVKNSEYFVLPINNSVNAISDKTKVELYGSNVNMEFNNASYIIDDNYSSFFGDIIVSTEEIVKPYNVKIDKRDEDEYRISTIHKGVVYDINIIFDHTRIINEIDIDLFTKYNCKIHRILYKETSHQSEEFKVYELLEDAQSENDKFSVILNKQIVAKEIRIVLYQDMHDKREYEILLSDYNNKEILEKIFRTEKEITLNNINKDLTQDEINQITNMNIYKAKLERFRQEWAEYKSRLDAYYSTLRDLERLEQLLQENANVAGTYDQMVYDFYMNSNKANDELSYLISQYRNLINVETIYVQRAFLVTD